jgi:hypothetical protein
LLDRVIFAYGQKTELDYTLMRPFNFIGPNLDNIEEPKEGSSRVFTQFLSNLMHGCPSSWSMAGSRSDRSPTSTMPWTASCGSSITAITAPAAHLQHRQSTELRVGGRSRPAHRAHCREFPDLAERARATQIIPVTVRAVLRPGLSGHPGARASHRSCTQIPRLVADDRHGHGDSQDDRVLRLSRNRNTAGHAAPVGAAA